MTAQIATAVTKAANIVVGAIGVLFSMMVSA
jgi:hypothetical protein